MTHLDVELRNLKSDVLEMFGLVLGQLEKSKEALVSLDKDLAREILVNEKRVNGYELKVDRDCENIIALFNPVAIDLRFVLACMKTNSNLERIGDIAEGIAQFILKFKLEPEKKLLEESRLLEMFDVSIEILRICMNAYETEDTKLARSVFKMDEVLDEININANESIAEFIRNNMNRINQSLRAFSICSGNFRETRRC
jgi:phosphate transport system protein